MCIAECPAEKSEAHPFGFNGLQSESLSFKSAFNTACSGIKRDSNEITADKKIKSPLEQKLLAGRPCSFTCVTVIIACVHTTPFS